MSKRNAPGTAFVTWYESADGDEVNQFLSDVAKAAEIATRLKTENEALRKELAQARSTADRAVSKTVQPRRTVVDDNDFTVLTNVIQLAALRATDGGDTYEHRVAKDKDEAEPVNVTEAFGASFDDLPDGRSGETN